MIGLYLFIDFISGDETTMNPSAYFEALFTLAADIPEYTVTKVNCTCNQTQQDID